MPRLKGRGPKRSHPAFPPEGEDRPRKSAKAPATKARGSAAAVPKPDGTKAGSPTPAGRSERITSMPGIFGGKPVIRGRRLAAEHVLGLLAAGETVETVLAAYPWLEREDVLACLAYAFDTVRDKHKPEGFVIL